MILQAVILAVMRTRRRQGAMQAAWRCVWSCLRVAGRFWDGVQWLWGPSVHPHSLPCTPTHSSPMSMHAPTPCRSGDIEHSQAVPYHLHTCQESATAYCASVLDLLINSSQGGCCKEVCAPCWRAQSLPQSLHISSKPKKPGNSLKRPKQGCAKSFAHSFRLCRICAKYLYNFSRRP